MSLINTSMINHAMIVRMKNIRKYVRPVSFGILILFFGVVVSGVLDLYYLIPHLDKFYHFFGGFAVAWFFYIYFSSDFINISKWKQLLIIVSTVCFIAVLWEYAERLSSVYSPHYWPWLYHWFQGGDLDDTLLDILFGMFGAISFVILKFIGNIKKEIV